MWSFIKVIQPVAAPFHLAVPDFSPPEQRKTETQPGSIECLIYLLVNSRISVVYLIYCYGTTIGALQSSCPGHVTCDAL
jgi:hypothetical protein